MPEAPYSPPPLTTTFLIGAFAADFFVAPAERRGAADARTASLGVAIV